ncbi:PAS domain S-box protein [Longimicrobium terrae]|uniref:histidine kinase n=1 Tax=Longimicrobium terrae TaxID=1639882 RepID=A0A841GUN1_9BACT|nr:PAS domain S-box protein [Longimicrobium terrae]MBB4634743.1 PAS domain S-box-containing protein [Longimicrobium terrae]MBB6069138.1 PAS domain S-box-containing protein [Longimicrobium terrae]NNC32045.1 PAS domain S-box protein [Longimicrobium terrae]
MVQPLSSSSRISPDTATAVLAQLPEAVMVADAAGRVTWANDAARTLHGGLAVGDGPETYGAAYQTVDGASLLLDEIPLLRAARGETLARAEWRIAREDGSEVVVQGSAAPLVDADGRGTGAVLSFRDASAEYQATRALLEQAAELEMQAEAMQTQAALLEEAQVELEMGSDELSRANREIEDARRQTRTVIDNAASALFLMDEEGRAVLWNPALEAMTGYGPDEIRGRVIHELVHHTRPDGRPYPIAECPFARALHGDVAVTDQEEVFIRADGTFFPVLCSARPLHQEGVNRGAVMEVRDITEQKRTEARDRFYAALAAALQPLSDPAELMSVTARMLGEHLGADRCAYAEVEADQDTFTITGDYARAGVPGIVGTFRMSEFSAEALRLSRAGEPYVVDDVLRDPRVSEADLAAYRQTHIAAVISVPLRKDGRFVAGMAVHQTRPRTWTPDEVELVSSVVQRCWESLERARALRGLRASEQRLQLAQEAGRVGSFDWMIPEDHIVWSPALERLYGLEPGGFSGGLDAWSSRVVAEDARRVQEQIGEAVARGDTELEYEFRAVMPGGGTRWFAGRARFDYDAGGQPVRMLGVNVDVDERRRAEEEREQHLADARQARAEAEAANRAKSQFLANMSHELRTPINAILGYTELLQMGIGGPVNEQQNAHLERVRASGRHLMGLVGELLDLAKVEAGQIEVERARVRAADTVNDALELVAPLAAERGIELRHIVAEHVAPEYWGDGDRTRQVLLNLLSNALKFTAPGGRVTVACATSEQAEDGVHTEVAGPWLRVDVEDTGIGIPDEKLAEIFDPFVQVESGYTRQTGGTGLGLTISRRLARLMGGDLVVHSEVGVGSCFSLWLPAAAPAEETADEAGWNDDAHAVAHLSEVGHALARRADAISRALGDRLRDSGPAGAQSLNRAELEDHAPTFLVDIGNSLIALDDGRGDPALLRDGSEIQRVIAELHGAQRARLGWTRQGLRQEFGILRQAVEQALRADLAATGGGARLDNALATVNRMLEKAEETSVRGWERSPSEAGRAEPPAPRE